VANELAKVSQTDLTPDVWRMYQEQAKYIAASGLVAGAVKPEQAVVLMLLGHDLGLSPTAAIRGIDLIQGRPTVKPQLMAALIVQAGHPRVRVIERSEKQCVLEFRHKDDNQVVTVSYTMEEGTKAGLSGKDVWKKNPADMLYNRCLGRGARQEYPEIFFNLYAPGEIVSDGDVVETTARPVEAPAAEPVELRPEISERLDRADSIKTETGIDTITDSFGTWAPIDKKTCEAGLKKLIAAADLPTAAKMCGLEGFKDIVKAQHPDATTLERAYSAILHIVFEQREKARGNSPDPAKEKAQQTFEDAVVTEIPAEEDEEF
jgi:hypothetical protein